jgi:predicted XRE-type DNA-binding protein
MMRKRRYESVWDAIETSPGAAAGLKARAGLMIALAGTIRRRGWTQRQAARRFGVAQPRVSDLVRGRIRLFSLDALVEMAALAGLRPRVVIGRVRGRAA